MESDLPFVIPESEQAARQEKPSYMPASGLGPRADAVLRALPPSVRDEKLRQTNNEHLTGPEVAALIQVNPSFRFSKDPRDRQTYLNWKQYRKEWATDWAKDAMEAVDFVKNLHVEGLSSFVKPKEGQRDLAGIMGGGAAGVGTLLPSAIESIAQATRDLIGMGTVSEDPNSVVFGISKILSGKGGNEEEEIDLVNRALTFGEKSRNLLEGKETMLSIPPEFLDNRQVQMLALWLDPPAIVGMATGGQVTAGRLGQKALRLMGAQRAARAMRGLTSSGAVLKARVAALRMKNAVIDTALGASVATVKAGSKLVTGTIDVGIGAVGKAVEYGTGFKADDVARMARRLGSFTPLAIPFGGIPVASTAATAYIAAKAASGFAEAMEEIRKSMQRSKGQRTLRTFAADALEGAAAQAGSLSPAATKVLTALDHMDPVLSASWVAAKGAAYGAGVGGLLAYLNGGPHAVGFGVGTGGTLGMGGALAGAGISRLSGATSNRRMETHAALGLENVIKPYDPETGRSYEILLGFPGAEDRGLVNTNQHREALLRSIVHYVNLSPVDRPIVQLYDSGEVNQNTGISVQLERIISELSDQGWSKDRLSQVEGAQQAGGLTFRDGNGKVRVLVDVNEFFQPGRDGFAVLPHEHVHALGMSGKVKPLLGAMEVGAVYGTFRRETGTRDIPSVRVDDSVLPKLEKGYTDGVFRTEDGTYVVLTDEPNGEVRVYKFGRGQTTTEIGKSGSLDEARELIWKDINNGAELPRVQTGSQKEPFEQYRLIGRGGVPWADVKSHARAWLASMGDLAKGKSDLIEGIIRKLENPKDNPLTLDEFNMVRVLANEYSTEYSAQRMMEDTPEFIATGRRTGFDAVKQALKERYRELIASEINHDQPLAFFNRVRRGPDGLERVDVNSGFYDPATGKLVRNAALDAVYEGVLKLAAVQNHRKKYDVSDLDPAIREMVLFNLGLDNLMERDSTGRVNKKRKGGRAKIDDKLVLGPEAVKMLKTMRPEDRTSVDTIEGGIAGPFSDKEFEALTLRGYISPAFADKARMIQRILADTGSSKVIAFDYSGESMQLFVDSDNARVFGDMVPMTSREVLIADLVMEFNAKGEFVARIRGLDLQVMAARERAEWGKPHVRRLWGDDYDAFHRDFWQLYLKNASLPAGHPDRKPSAELWTEDGEAKRNVMHQVAGFAKGDDYTWLNTPIAQIPRGTMMAITDFSLGRMGIVQEQLQRTPVHYDHRNAFHDISRNFRAPSWSARRHANGATHTNPLGYVIEESNGKYRVFTPHRAFVGVEDDANRALAMAESDFERRVSTFREKETAVIIEAQSQFQDRPLGLDKTGPNPIPFDMLDLQTSVAQMIDDGARPGDVMKALEGAGLDIQVVDPVAGIFHSGLLGKFMAYGERSPLSLEFLSKQAPFASVGTVKNGVQRPGMERLSMSRVLSSGFWGMMKSKKGKVTLKLAHAGISPMLYGPQGQLDGYFARKDPLPSSWEIPAHTFFATHPMGAGMAVRRSGEWADMSGSWNREVLEDFRPPSAAEIPEVLARPMLIVRSSFNNLKFIETSQPEMRIAFAEELTRNRELRALVRGALDEKGLPIFEPSPDAQALGMHNHDLMVRWYTETQMLRALDEGHDGLAISKMFGVKSNIAFRGIDVVRLYPNDSFAQSPGLAVSSNTEVIARSASINTENGKLVYNKEIERVLRDSRADIPGMPAPLTPAEIRTSPAMTVGGRNVVSERAGDTQYLHRAKSLAMLRVKKATGAGSSMEKAIRSMTEKIFSDDQGYRPFPSTPLKYAEDVEAAYQRYMDVSSVLLSEFDNGTMTRAQWEQNSSEAVASWRGLLGRSYVEHTLSSDIFVLSSRLDDDFSTLANDGSVFVGGNRKSGINYGSTQVAEIGPVDTNRYLDEIVADYAREGMLSDLDVGQDGITVNDARRGRSNELSMRLQTLAAAFNQNAGGLVRIEVVSRQSSLAEAPGETRPMYTFVWTERAKEIRQIYRSAIGEDIWGSPNFELQRAARQQPLRERLSSNQELVNILPTVRQELDKSARAAKALFGDYYSKKYNESKSALAKVRTQKPTDYETYVNSRKSERDSVSETALSRALESLAMSPDGGDRFKILTDVKTLMSHRLAIKQAEAIGSAWRSFSGTQEGMMGFSAAVLEKLSSIYESTVGDLGMTPEGKALQQTEAYTSTKTILNADSADNFAALSVLFSSLETLMSKTKEDFANIAYADSFKSGLRTAVATIIEKNPGGITASNFRKEMEKLHSAGVPNLEEARVTGLLEFLAEKEKLPKLPNGKSPKLDLKELSDFVEATKLEVELDAKPRLNVGENGRGYLMHPVAYVSDYGVLAGRVAPEAYYTSSHNSSQHVYSKDGRSHGPDVILHTRYTIRDMPELDGTIAKTLFVEEMQMNNDKKYVESAAARSRYWEAVDSAISDLLPTLEKIYGTEASGSSVLSRYKHDPDNPESLANFYAEMARNISPASNTRPFEYIVTPQLAFVNWGDRLHRSFSTIQGGFGSGETHRELPFLHNREMVNVLGISSDFYQSRAVDEALATTSAMTKMFSNRASGVAAAGLRSIPKAFSSIFSTLAEQSFAPGATQVNVTFLRDLMKDVFRTGMTRHKLLEPGNPLSAKQAADMLSKFNIKFTSSGVFERNEISMYTSAHAMSSALAANFAKMIPEKAWAEITRKVIEILNTKGSGFSVMLANDLSFENLTNLFKSEVKFGGKSVAEIVRQIVKDNLVLPETGSTTGPFGEQTKTLVFRLKQSGEPEQVVELPFFNKDKLAEYAIMGAEVFMKVADYDSSSLAEVFPPGSGGAFLRPIINYYFEKKSAEVMNESLDLVKAFTAAGYRDYALGSSVEVVTDRAKALGIPVGRNLKRLVEATRSKNPNTPNLDFGQHLLYEVINNRLNASRQYSTLESGWLNGGLSVQEQIKKMILEVQEQTNLAKVQKEIPKLAQERRPALMGAKEDSHIPLFMALANPALNLPLVPDFIKKAVNDSHSGLSIDRVLRPFALAQTGIDYGTSDPAKFREIMFLSEEEIYNAMKAGDWHRRAAVYDQIKPIRYSSENEPSLVDLVTSYGLESTTFGKFIRKTGHYPMGFLDPEMHPADAAYRERSKAVGQDHYALYNRDSDGGAIEAALKRLKRGSIQPKDAVNEIKAALINEDSYGSDRRKEDRRLSRLPFMESDEYFGVGVKMLLKEALVKGAKRIVLLPPTDGGSRSGLSVHKAPQIYGNIITARIKKIANKELGIPVVDNGQRLLLPTSRSPQDAKHLVDAMDAAAKRLPAAKKSSMAIAKWNRGTGVEASQVLPSRTMLMGAVLGRVLEDFDVTSADADVAARIYDRAAESLIEVLSNVNDWTSRDAIVHTGSMHGSDHRTGGQIPLNSPNLIPEIFAIGMYKAAKDAPPRHKLNVKTAVEVSASYALMAHSDFWKILGLDYTDHGSYASRVAEIRRTIDEYKNKAIAMDGITLGNTLFESALKRDGHSASAWVERVKGLKELLASNEVANKDAIKEGILEIEAIAEAIIGEIDANIAYYSSVPDDSFYMAQPMQRNINIEMHAAPDKAREKIMDGQFFYRSKGYRGQVKAGSRGWNVGFLGEIAQTKPSLASKVRLIYKEAQDASDNYKPVEVTLYPKGDENLSETGRTITASAVLDRESMVAHTRMHSFDKTGELALMAMNELERRLTTMGFDHIIGDSGNALAYGRIDTDELPSFRPTSFKSDYSRSRDGAELTDTLYKLGYNIHYGTERELYNTYYAEPLPSTRLSSQRPESMKILIGKMERDGEKGISVTFKVRPDGIAEIEEMNGDYATVAKNFDKPEQAAASLRMLILAELMWRMREWKIESVEGFQRIVSPNEDAIWDGYKGQMWAVPRSWHPEHDGKEGPVPYDFDDMTTGELLAQERQKQNKVSYDEFLQVVKGDNQVIGSPESYSPEYTPEYYTPQYGIGFIMPPLTANVRQDVSYRSRTWDMGKTGNYTTISSSDGYFIMMSEGKFRLFSPNRVMLGIFNDREKAYRRAEAHSRKGK